MAKGLIEFESQSEMEKRCIGAYIEQCCPYSCWEDIDKMIEELADTIVQETIEQVVDELTESIEKHHKPQKVLKMDILENLKEYKKENTEWLVIKRTKSNRKAKKRN